MAIRRDAADKWFSDAVRMRDKSTCRSCGKEGRTECAHIYGRANKRLRWSTENALALCHYCHQFYTANPLDFYAFLYEEFGEEAMIELKRKSNEIYKTSKALRKEISAFYRNQVRRMENESGHVLENFQP